MAKRLITILKNIPNNVEMMDDRWLLIIFFHYGYSLTSGIKFLKWLAI